MKRSISLILGVLLIVSLVLAACGTASADTRISRVRTLDNGASLRDRPRGGKIGTVQLDTELEVISYQDGWFCVIYDGQTGWVYIDQITILSTPADSPAAGSLI